jgi:hypothetical protein
MLGILGYIFQCKVRSASASLLYFGLLNLAIVARLCKRALTRSSGNMAI